jgi:hypothetical protein
VERLINQMRQAREQQQVGPEQFQGMSEDEIFQQLQQNPQMMQQMEGIE